jgi:hypothetical protein
MQILFGLAFPTATDSPVSVTMALVNYYRQYLR